MSNKLECHVMVATCNVVHPCGEHFLSKGRIIGMKRRERRFIYRSIEDYNREIESAGPWDMIHNNQLRPATEQEIEWFKEGVKSIPMAEVEED